jgi:hypothetical protein
LRGFGFETPAADPIKHFSFFKVKLGDFTINYFFLYVTNAKAYQQKTVKSSLAKKKSFIGWATYGV